MTVESYAARRMARHFYHMELILSDRHYISFMKRYVDFDFSAVELIISDIFAYLFFKSSPEESIGRGGSYFHSIAVTHIIIAETMVKMHMCIDNLSEAKIVFGNEFIKKISFGPVKHSGVDDNGLKRVTVIGYESAFGEEIEDEMAYFQHYESLYKWNINNFFGLKEWLREEIGYRDFQHRTPYGLDFIAQVSAFEARKPRGISVGTSG